MNIWPLNEVFFIDKKYFKWYNINIVKIKGDLKMKFNEAIDEVRSHENTYDETSGTMQTFSVLDMIDELREEYAPTIEMTKEQARVFQLYYDSERPFNKSELEYPDNLFMRPIKEKDIIHAWLHPESIVVVK